MLRLVHKNELRTQIVSVITPCATKLIMHARLDLEPREVIKLAANEASCHSAQNSLNTAFALSLITHSQYQLVTPFAFKRTLNKVYLARKKNILITLTLSLPRKSNLPPDEIIYHVCLVAIYCC